jgi:glycerol-3-phosphate O-acyltransferase
MSETIIVPLWLLFVLILLAALAILDRVLLPGTRWYVQKKVRRVIDEVGTRLDIGIKPFQLTRRHVLIEQLLNDPGVNDAIYAHSHAYDMPMEKVRKRVRKFSREIVPSFNAYIYFRIGYWVAKKVARLLYDVRVGLLEDEQFSSIDPNATVVFVMNHRSNMDYILVAFLAAESTALSYAVGEWARIWPLQMLIRAMGAYFVRRDSGDPLYRRVLERYIQMATREGVCQAVFPEGGLSRDGKLRKPKLGFVDYMLRAFNPAADRDIVFIPVGINYDRVIEDRSLLRANDPEAKRRSRWFVARTTAGFIFRSLTLMLLSRWERFGYACVNFGTPVSVNDYARDHGVNFQHTDRAARFEEIEKLCAHLMASIRDIIPVLPVSLVSIVFLRSGSADMDIREIEVKTSHLVRELQKNGAPVFETPRSRLSRVVFSAVSTLTTRRIVLESMGRFQTAPGQESILQYYANAIAPWLNPAEPTSPESDS